MSDPKKSAAPAKGKATLPRQLSAGEITRQLQIYYDCIVDEGIPDRFLDLLETLHRIEEGGSGPSGKE